MAAERISRLPSWVNYIGVEGPIGVGKTSLCNLMAQRYGARLVLEAAEENPFLERFYRDRRTWAFQTQLWFLVSRFKQLSEEAGQQDLFYRITVSDYIFVKDRIFAGVTLDEEEYALYEQVATAMGGRITTPDLVVYLQASTDMLLKRIERRGRPYEFNMDPRYIATLNEAYNHFFFHYSDSPLLIINTDDIDFVNDTGDLEELLLQIENAGKGTSFYRPMPAKDKAKLQQCFLQDLLSDDTRIEEPQ